MKRAGEVYEEFDGSLRIGELDESLLIRIDNNKSASI
jgi:hypothetical protein